MPAEMLLPLSAADRRQLSSIKTHPFVSSKVDVVAVIVVFIVVVIVVVVNRDLSKVVVVLEVVDENSSLRFIESCFRCCYRTLLSSWMIPYVFLKRVVSLLVSLLLFLLFSLLL